MLMKKISCSNIPHEREDSQLPEIKSNFRICLKMEQMTKRIIIILQLKIIKLLE